MNIEKTLLLLPFKITKKNSVAVARFRLVQKMNNHLKIDFLVEIHSIHCRRDIVVPIIF
jgi:hypothetical protein